ncbi:hypothetical protein BS101_19980 [Clostridium kluyveri]|uniref:Tn3 transposase DDE domain-containing protein n=2 Tax=Clostridium kluyveri TaxID=1534 RepID=A0A1L5FCZ8_CLOKL|nr:hypothetical protein BS101_19980 [Clostridium kluyveri]
MLSNFAPLIGQGVTYYNYTSDQFTGLHGIVIPGIIRDSLYLLKLVLEQQTELQPKEIMTDTAGYSDIVFGLFGLLGSRYWFIKVLVNRF